jgi:hypothetical protein
MGSWFLHDSNFFADFDQNTKEVPTKISKKNFFFVPSKKEILFITVLSFFYAFGTR